MQFQVKTHICYTPGCVVFYAPKCSTEECKNHHKKWSKNAYKKREKKSINSKKERKNEYYIAILYKSLKIGLKRLATSSKCEYTIKVACERDKKIEKTSKKFQKLLDNA